MSSLAIYGRFWCLHQFVPFIDKMLGLAGAMDNRMLGSMDFPVRLPVLLAAFVFPNSQVLLLAHLVNIVSWALWMPHVWDYMCWCALTEIVFVVAALAGGGDEKVAQRFVPAVKAMLIILYFSAAFWKLTSSWFDLRSSCAVILMSELLSSKLFPPGPETFYKIMMELSPILVAALEFVVPIFLWLAPRFGVMIALVFHQTINLMPMTYAGGFSIAMCARMHLWIPCLFPEGSDWVVPSAMSAAIMALMYFVHDRLDAAGTAFCLFTMVYIRGVLFPGKEGFHVKVKEGGAWLRYGAWTLGFLYGFVFPVIGIEAMNSSTMYGNVLQFHGNNHWIVPTGLLQTHYYDRKPTGKVFAHVSGDWFDETMVDAFGGGMLRVESTDSPVINQLCPAEATADLPTRAKELLPRVGSTGKYFEMYAARNYYNRPWFNLTSTAIHSGAGKNEVLAKSENTVKRYVVPAFEMRRLLQVARQRKETFQMTYTKIPKSMTTVSEWRTLQGGAKVELVEEPGKTARCTVSFGGKTTACEPSEAALLPPPPSWLQWILLPYPVPLVEGETHNEIHCST